MGDAAAPAVAGDYIRPTGLEVATSWMHGVLPATPLPPPTTASPRAALADAIRPALLAPPCYVTFSGGRDSSAVLAVAMDVARREHLPEPIPVTELHPDVPEAEESAWQRLVIDHLGVREWVRLEVRGEHDLLGPAAQAGLLRRGLVWPAALHVQETGLRAMAGGSILTGEGGDEVLGPRRITPLTLLLRKRRRPRPVLLRAATAAAAPGTMRRALHRPEMRRAVPWLTPAARRQHLRRLADDTLTEPLHWGRAVWGLTRRRVPAVLTHNHSRLAAEHGATVHDPLLDPGFLAALAHHGGRWGFAGRTALMRELFSDLLPDVLLARATKAAFNFAYSGAASREFALAWDGSGVDESLVDPVALRAAWLAERPSGISALLMQSAWLAGQRSRQLTGTV